MLKNTLIIAITILGLTAAHAEDKPKEVSCGKTTQECQEKLDKAAAMIAKLDRQIATYRDLLTQANDRLVATAAGQ